MSPRLPTYTRFRAANAFMFDLPSEFTYMPLDISARRQISKRVWVYERLDLSKIEVVA